MKHLLLSLLVALPSLAQAAPSISIPCADASTLEKDDQGCEENDTFSKAGQSCLDAMESTIKKQSGAVSAAMTAANAARSAGGANAQNSNFAGSAQDYALSQATLAELIRASLATRATTDAMLDHVYYPEDFDAPEEVIGDPKQFLDNQDCYTDARQSLEKTVAKMDSDIADLKKGQVASAQKGATSSGNQNGTQSLQGGAAPKGSGTDTGPVPTQGYDPSDISGTEKQDN